MKKGGYQIIDLSAYKFTNGETQSIANVYNTLKNTKKVVLISGLTVDGTEYHDMFTVFIPYETYFLGLAQYEGNNIYFVVKNDGRVEVNVASAETPIAYSYNNVNLPQLPNWDKTLYPYAVISGDTFYASQSPVKQVVGFGTSTKISAPYVSAKLLIETNNISWGELSVSDSEYSSFLTTVWANHNVLKSDGSIGVEASNPVPVNLPLILYEGDVTTTKESENYTPATTITISYGFKVGDRLSVTFNGSTKIYVAKTVDTYSLTIVGNNGLNGNDTEGVDDGGELLFTALTYFINRWECYFYTREAGTYQLKIELLGDNQQ